MENDKTTITVRQKKEKQALLTILKEMPIIEVACKKTGIGRATYYRWRKEDKNFLRQCEDAVGQGTEFINDMSESQMITLIKEKKMPAIAMWLRHHHKRYGSKAQPYVPIATSVDLSDEEQELVLKALALASGTIIPKNNYDGNVASAPREDLGEQKSPAGIGA